jgi:hypothetical protein
VVGVLLAAGAARADTVRATFNFAMFTANGAASNAQAGDAFSVDLIETMSGGVAFQFYWTGTAWGAAESVFWDDRAGLLTGTPTISDSDNAGTAVSYELVDVVPPNPEADVPSANTIGFDADYGARSTSGDGGIARAVDQLGEWVRFDFTLAAMKTWQDVLAAIQLGAADPFESNPNTLRIATHIQSLPDGASNSYVIVPLPPAAWAGVAALAGIGGFGYIRRRSFRA